jgi:hypothetical protein
VLVWAWARCYNERVAHRRGAWAGTCARPWAEENTYGGLANPLEEEAQLSAAPGEVARRRPAPRRKASPVTWLILVLVLVVVLLTMFLAIFQVGPFGPTEAPLGVVTPSVPHAAGLKVEKAGEPVRNGDQVTVQVRITNDVKQAPAAHGTPTPGAPTPQPEPARVLNASVKVLFFGPDPANSNRSVIVGSGVGNFYSEQGLAPGESATVEVVATGVGEIRDWQAYPDAVWTDKDPLKTPEPISGYPSPAQPGRLAATP